MPDIITYDDLPPKVQEKLDSLYDAFQWQRYRDAIGGLSRIVDKYPSYVHGVFTLGIALRATGARARANKRFVAVARIAPRDPRVLLGLAWSRLDVEDSKGARRLATSALRKADLKYRGDVVAVLAFAAEAEGKAAQAAQLYLQAYETGTQLGWLKAYCRLAGVEYALDDDAASVPWPVKARVRRQMYTTIARDLDAAARKKDPGVADENTLTAGCDGTARLTARWAVKARVERGPLYQALAARGGYCDCEVLMNAASEDDEAVARQPAKAKAKTKTKTKAPTKLRKPTAKRAR